MTMTNDTTGNETSLQDVLYQLSIAQAVPDAELLEDFVRRYPEHAQALTDFAVELVLDAASGGDDTSVEKDEVATSRSVARAMSLFQNQLFAAEQGEKNVQSHQARQEAAVVQNPFSALDGAAFRGLAMRLNANRTFLIKLRDRQIVPTTMTDGFRRRISEELDVPAEVVAAHFAAHPELSGRPQYYKADQKPEMVAQQTFEEAVKSSGLTEEQQGYLMSL